MRGGAVFLDDLLTREDRQQLGWPAIFGDYLGLVSQRVAAHASVYVVPRSSLPLSMRRRSD